MVCSSQSRLIVQKDGSCLNLIHEQQFNTGINVVTIPNLYTYLSVLESTYEFSTWHDHDLIVVKFGTLLIMMIIIIIIIIVIIEEEEGKDDEEEEF